MKKIDTRKVSSELQQHNRDLAIRLFQQGHKRAEIAEIIGVHYTVACSWIRAWRLGGEQAIKLGQRGRRPEEQRRLTGAQRIHFEEADLRQKSRPNETAFCALESQSNTGGGQADVECSYCDPHHR